DFLKLIGARSIVNSTTGRELRPPAYCSILIRKWPTGTFDGDLVRSTTIGFQVVKLAQARESTIQYDRSRSDLMGQSLCYEKDGLDECAFPAAVCASEDRKRA